MIVPKAFANRTVAVFGLARSGLAAARALIAAGADVRAWDDAPAKREDAARAGITLADLAAGFPRDAAALVLAPGVPLTHPAPHPVVRAAAAAGVTVIGDIELFVQAIAGSGARLVGVTGTNGKSTTTALIGHLLAHSGRRVQVGGNIGTPVLDLDPPGRDGTYVLELSSYQLDLSPSWHAEVAVLLNLTPDHIDRHGSMANYVAIKRRVFGGQRPGDVAVIGVDDDWCAGIARELAAAGGRLVLPVAVGRRLADGVSVVDGRLFDRGVELADIAALPTLPGRHNWQNAAAAYAAVRALGLLSTDILAGLASFPGLAHRMEPVGRLGAVRFVNDSKATNADAAAKALACYQNVYWIAGGRAKEGGIAALAPLFGRIRHAYLIGEAAPAFAATLKGRVPATIAGALDQAVGAAAAQARLDGLADAVVLLSPACASFDQFRDFEHRGDTFRRLVAALTAESNGAAA